MFELVEPDLLDVLNSYRNFNIYDFKRRNSLENLKSVLRSPSFGSRYVQDLDRVVMEVLFSDGLYAPYFLLTVAGLKMLLDDPAKAYRLGIIYHSDALSWWEKRTDKEAIECRVNTFLESYPEYIAMMEYMKSKKSRFCCPTIEEGIKYYEEKEKEDKAVNALKLFSELKQRFLQTGDVLPRD